MTIATKGNRRATRQRAAIAEVLDGATGFRSAQAIHDELRERKKQVGLTTVYRTLQALSESGDVDVLRGEDGESLYRRCDSDDHHHHLVCRNCGYSIEIDNEEVEEWTRRAASRHGFTQVTHDLEIFGSCRSCAARTS